jgi:hypothetical protein
MTIEIMFLDLNEQKQQELLASYEITDPNEANWGIVPIAIIETEETNTT